MMLAGMNEHGGVAVLVAIFNAANTVHGHGRRCERNERATHARARKPPLPDNQRTRAPLQDRPACAERIRLATEISRKTHDRPAYRPTPACCLPGCRSKARMPAVSWSIEERRYRPAAAASSILPLPRNGDAWSGQLQAPFASNPLDSSKVGRCIYLAQKADLGRAGAQSAAHGDLASIAWVARLKFGAVHSQDWNRRRSWGLQVLRAWGAVLPTET